MTCPGKLHVTLSFFLIFYALLQYFHDAFVVTINLLHLAAMPRMVENTIMFIFFPTSTSFLSFTPSYFLFLFFLAWKLCHLEWDNALGFFLVRCWKKNMKLFFMALTRGQKLVVATENHYLCGPWKAPGKKKVCCAERPRRLRPF